MSVGGRWAVTPYRFRPLKKQGIPNFDLICFMTHNGYEVEKQSGDSFPLGSSVSFLVQPSGGLMDPYDKVDVYWEVSNGGEADHHEHDDIYYKGEEKSGGKRRFNREVSYRGKHLLRCRVHNRNKRLSVTKIFIVNGVS